MLLEKNHDDYSALAQNRQQEEQQLHDVRNLYKETQLAGNKEKKKCEFYKLADQRRAFSFQFCWDLR